MSLWLPNGGDQRMTPDYKELAAEQELKIRSIKEMLKEVMKYINKDIYSAKSGKVKLKWTAKKH